MKRQITLPLSLPIETALQRLREQTVPVSNFWLSFPRHANNKILCTISEGNRFRLRVKHPYGNGLTSFFQGTFKPSGSGCMLEGQFFVLTWIRWLMAFQIVSWLGIALYVLLPLALTGMPLRSCVLILAYFCTVMGLLLLLLTAIARLLGKNDEIQMVLFLTELFKEARQ